VFCPKVQANVKTKTITSIEQSKIAAFFQYGFQSLAENLPLDLIHSSVESQRKMPNNLCRNFIPFILLSTYLKFLLIFLYFLLALVVK
jgi:hypothetical protein